MEIAELHCDSILKQKPADEGIPKFYSDFDHCYDDQNYCNT